MHSPSVTRDRGGRPDGGLLGALHALADIEGSLGWARLEADGPAVCPGDAALRGQDGKILPDGLPRNAELVAERSDPDSTLGVHEPDDGQTAFARERVHWAWRRSRQERQS